MRVSVADAVVRQAPLGRSRSWAELRWALALSTTISVASCLPYVMATASPPTGQQFLGFVFNPDEPNVHLSWIRQASEGAVFFRNEFTSEPHEARFFNLFMLACGRAAAATGRSPYEVWAVARVLCAVLFGLCAYLAATSFIGDRRVRRLSLLVITLGSGLGWLWVSGDGHASATNPLSVLALVLLLQGLVWGERAISTGCWPSAVGAALAGLLLRAMPGPDALLLIGCLVGYAGLRQLRYRDAWTQRRWHLLMIVAVAHPAVWRPDWQEAALPTYVPLVLAWLVYVGLASCEDQRALWWLRLVGPLLAALVSWSWFGVGLGLDPVDAEPGLVMPEALGFLSIYLGPLFTCSMALLVLSLYWSERALRRVDWLAVGGAGLAALLLANIHTYDAVPLALVVTSYLLALAWRERRWSWPRAQAWLSIALLALPGVAYQYWLIQSQPLYAAKANTVTATPHLTTMLVSYGWLVPLALLGLVTRLRQGDRPGLFFACWLVVHALCCYLPTSLFPFQRKMIEGFCVVLGLQAAYGLWVVARQAVTLLTWPAVAARYRRLGNAWTVRADWVCRRRGWVAPAVGLGLLVGLSPGSLLFVEHTQAMVASNNLTKQAAFMPPFFMPESELAAWDWMAANLPEDAVVLCLPYVGSYLPGRVGRTVYLGHWAETIDFGRKVQQVGEFFKVAQPAETKRQFLVDNGITHVYFGVFERLATAGQYPALPELRRAYPSGEDLDLDFPPVQVFAVVDESPVKVESVSPTPVEDPTPADDASAVPSE